MIQSKYLKQSDVPDPVIVTIRRVKQVNVAKEDAEPEYKWAIKFAEFQKPMILNSTNIRIAEKVLGDDTDKWTGKEITLWSDPNVSFGNELVGGLRFRAQEKPPVRKPARKSAFDDMHDDVPWPDDEPVRT